MLYPPELRTRRVDSSQSNAAGEIGLSSKGLFFLGQFGLPDIQTALAQAFQELYSPFRFAHLELLLFDARLEMLLLCAQQCKRFRNLRLPLRQSRYLQRIQMQSTRELVFKGAAFRADRLLPIHESIAVK